MLRIKWVLSFGFLLMGFTFTVTQGLMIRELLVAFFGNEISIGLILGGWLLLEAFGSGLLGKLANRWGKDPKSFAVLQVLFALLLPLCLYAAYTSRRLAGTIPGEGVGLTTIFWASFIILAPIALIDGAMFSFGSRSFAALVGGEAPSIGKVYVLEALGAIVGGILFTFVLIPFYLSIQIALLLIFLNLLAATLILITTQMAKVKRTSSLVGLVLISTLIVAGLSLMNIVRSDKIQHWFSSKQWPGLELVYSKNSAYGNVAVVKRESQYTFFTDGIPVLITPLPDIVLIEEIVHLPMTFLHEPQRALVVGGGLGGVINELTKYPLQSIEYSELDPLLIEAVKTFPTSLTTKELSDQRLIIYGIDGRLLLRGDTLVQENGYDLVVVNSPYPSTLRINRYFTAEFFRLVRRIMTEDGILVMPIPGTLTYMSDELRDLNTMVQVTLEEVFPHVRPVPGDLTLWLASPSNDLNNQSVESLSERWDRRQIVSRLINTQYIHLRLGNMRLDWFLDALQEDEEVQVDRINRDLHPIGLLYGLAYWHALFSPHLIGIFKLIRQLDLWMVVPFLLGCSLLLLGVISRISKRRDIILTITIASTGFAGMTADLVVIFAFQSLFGVIFQWIVLIVTAFMAGLSLGGFLMTRKMEQKRKNKRTLLLLEAGLVIYWLLVPIILVTLYSGTRFANSIHWILLVINIVGGFLVGSQFPLANQMLLKGREKPEGSVGLLYASDLIGAFLGAIAVSVILIPVLGIPITCLFAAVLKTVSLLLVVILPKIS